MTSTDSHLKVVWRDDGHTLNSTTDLLRFDVADLNRVINRSVADAHAYSHLNERAGLPSGFDMLPISCFAVTADWPLRRVLELDPRSYRLAPAHVLIDNGLPVIPTRIFEDGVEAAGGDVHYDVIIVAKADLLDTFKPGQDRKRARATVRPAFEKALGLLGDLHQRNPSSDVR